MSAPQILSKKMRVQCLVVFSTFFKTKIVGRWGGGDRRFQGDREETNQILTWRERWYD